MKNLLLVMLLLLTAACSSRDGAVAGDSTTNADAVVSSTRDVSMADVPVFDVSASEDADTIQIGDSAAVDLTEPDVGEHGDLDPQIDTISMSPASTIYPTNRIHSPFTPAIQSNLLAIFKRGQLNGLRPHVFAKLGASFEDSTVAFVGCLKPTTINLGPYTNLQATVDYFSKDIGGGVSGNAWTRNSDAAISGWAAKDGLKVKNGKSAIERELDKLKPAFALIAYNGNDIGKSSITAYHANMTTIIKLCLSRGIIPILRTKTREETTSTTRPQKIIFYNAVIRGLAQQYQIPFLDLNLAIKDVPGALSTGDHLHLSSYSGKNCWFTEEGLKKGKPIYNLRFLQTMDRVRKTVIVEQTPPDSPTPIVGKGTHAEPFIVDLTQFEQFRNKASSSDQDISMFSLVHVADTSKSNQSKFDDYPPCGEQSEAGNEVVYRLVLPKGDDGETVEGKLTLRVFENATIDVDPHWLTSLSPDSCVARDDENFVITDVSSGTYYFVLDTFTNKDGLSKPGAALFSIVFEPGI